MKLFEISYSPLANHPTDEQAFRILARLPGGAGTKFTYAERFDDLDNMLLEEIEQHYPRDRVLTFHDIAASTAITSLRTYKFLAARRSIQMRATDYYDEIWIVKLSRLNIFFDVDWAPLQYALGPVGISAVRSPLRKLLRPLASIAQRRRDRAKRISLFDPRAREVARVDPHFTLGRENFFEPSQATYDIVRLANAVTPLTPHDKLTIIFRNVCGQVRDGGLLILGRARAYTIYVRRGDHFESVRVLGKGNEFHPD